MIKIWSRHKYTAILVFGLLGTAGLAPVQANDTAVVRRIVTGVDDLGKSVVLYDTDQTGPAALQEPVARDFWTLEGFPARASMDDNAIAEITDHFGPGPQKLVFRSVDIPPAPPAEILEGMDVNMLMTVAGDEAPKDGNDPVHPFMHRTKTIDFVVVMSGELDLVLDDSTVHLKAGDVAVQQNNNHAWVNNSGVVARIVVVQVASDIR